MTSAEKRDLLTAFWERAAVSECASPMTNSDICAVAEVVTPDGEASTWLVGAIVRKLTLAREARELEASPLWRQFYSGTH